MNIWIAGRYRDSASGAWEIIGAFSSEDLAVAACTEALDFVGSLTLDVRLPEVMTSWPGAYYPAMRGQPTD